MIDQALGRELEGVKYFSLNAKDLRFLSVSCRRMSGNGMEVVLQTAQSFGSIQRCECGFWTFHNASYTNGASECIDDSLLARIERPVLARTRSATMFAIAPLLTRSRAQAGSGVVEVGGKMRA